MELCSDGHDEVCYESHKCPVCEAHETLTARKDKIYDLEKKIDELEAELNADNN